ncbi:nanos homolog 1-like [Bufo gargarizans]|uniref:nanos homolog 1-like n=1 Tax=Bufo gargarizans TaxID=30331 RepID=UPI001CF244CF|nr:nanos homolog 1-like [Bufo gargarizans]
MHHDTNLYMSITMEFNPWRDYFQLASLVQKMARMEIAKPPPVEALLINSPKEGQANGEDSLTCLIPIKDEHTDIFKLPDSFSKDGLNSLHNLKLNKHLAYQYQAKTLDDIFQTEIRKPIKPSQVPVLSSAKRQARSRVSAMCHFCKHNGESRHVYCGHNLKDEQGKIICPILRMYTCSLCGATGESSHTRKYCPINKKKKISPQTLNATLLGTG